MASLLSVVSTSSPSSPSGFGAPARRVHDLRVEVVLEDVQAGELGALDADAGADDLREPVDVVGPHVALGVDAAAHRLRPGLRAEDAHAQRQRAQVDPHLPRALEDVHEVARGAADDAHVEVLEHHDLPVRVPARDRDHRGAERLAAVVGAEPAGEEAVAVGVLDHVVRTDAAGREAPDHDARPDVDVLLRVRHHDRLAGRAARGVQAHDLRERAREEAERVRVAQVRLLGEGQLRDPLQRVDAGGRDAPRVHALPQQLDPLVGAGHDRLQPSELHVPQLRQRQEVERARRMERCCVRHGISGHG